MTKQLSKLFILALSCQLLFTGYSNAQTGTWTAVKKLPPHFNMGVCLLMTDGTVICHNSNGGGEGTGWDRLTPDVHGSYINGTWDTIASMNNDRLFFSSQVLPSGKVYAAGGEYGAGGPAGGELYDPVANTWTEATNFPANWNIYDGNSQILYNGTVLEGPQIDANYTSFSCLFYNASTNSYSSAPTALLNHDEAEWVKLPDSSVLYVGIGNDTSNRYIPQTNTWVKDAVVPGYIYDYYGYESGCGEMLPNGKAIFFGATPYNAIYTPSGNATPGTWASADSFPVIQGTRVGQPDASGAMMVNGHILLAVSPIGTSTNEFNTPAYFVEYNYTTNKFTQVKSIIPGQSGDSIAYIGSYETQMLDLPDGNVLVSISQTYTDSNQYYIYTPGSAAIPQGKPVINNVIADGCSSYQITGKLFNGISEGAAYGDDWQMSTNYPLVRLTNGTNVYYAKTTNWNRIGAVQTDSLEDTAYFALPSMPGGTYSVEVVVNGFASNPTPLTVFGVGITAQTNISCYGNNTGSATALASNGTAPYTYIWSPGGETGTSISNLTAGIYTVTVTGNGGGCSVTAPVTITQPALLSASISSAVSCGGGSTARASVNLNGGTSPYTYSWSGTAGTNATATGLSIGTYSVMVSDSCGNSTTASVTINGYTAMNVSIVTVSNITCYGDTTAGTIMANVSGGSPPFTYTWSSGYGYYNEDYNLSAGNYTVTVSDSCGNSTTASAVITQPMAITVSTNSISSDVSICNGEASVSVSGGTPPYSYYWNDPAGSTTQTITNECARSYCCTVTDNNGCSEAICDIIITATTAGINNVTSNNGNITVYPNPSKGIFTIQSSVGSGQSSVEVYNVLGEKIYTSTLPPASGSGVSFTYQMNLSAEPSGVYLYRVIEDNGNLIGEGKLIIDK